jgi:DnaJ-class molecular chaperone
MTKRAPTPVVVRLTEDELRDVTAKLEAFYDAEPGDPCPMCRGTGRNQICRAIICGACRGTGVRPERIGYEDTVY